MSYDDEVETTLLRALPSNWLTTKPVRDAIPPLTLKTEDGRFVKVEQCDPRTLEEYPTYDGWFRIMEDQP